MLTGLVLYSQTAQRVLLPTEYSDSGRLVYSSCFIDLGIQRIWYYTTGNQTEHCHHRINDNSIQYSYNNDTIFTSLRLIERRRPFLAPPLLVSPIQFYDARILFPTGSNKPVSIIPHKSRREV